MEWVSNCVSHWSAIPSVSLPSCSCISFTQDKFWIKFLWVHWCSYLPLDVPLVIGGGLFRSMSPWQASLEMYITHPGTSHPCRISPVRRTGSTDRQQSQNQACSSCWKKDRRTKLHICYKLTELYDRGRARPAYVCFWLVVQSLRTSKGPGFQVSWLCWFSFGDPIFSGFLNSSPNSSRRLVELLLIFGCGMCTTGVETYPDSEAEGRRKWEERNFKNHKCVWTPCLLQPWKLFEH